ncbi:MAG TPA: c-type cytochrome [Candidatus Polarisedimenticolaceae bacterium]|nr:c-type cytochrome [Candidatus Polarisedimenticolaceae bacterium]
MSARSCLLLAALLVGCTGCAAAPPQERTERARGEILYVSWNCAPCHGEARQGTEFGPPLTDLARHWEVGFLAAHLADPDAGRARDARLQALTARFPAPMPGFAQPEQDRQALAAWLLARGTAR